MTSSAKTFHSGAYFRLVLFKDNVANLMLVTSAYRAIQVCMQPIECILSMVASLDFRLLECKIEVTKLKPENFYTDIGMFTLLHSVV